MSIDPPENNGLNLNNPTKEIFQSRSGVFDGTIIGTFPYAPDIGNSILPNTGVATTSTTTSTTEPPTNLNHALLNFPLGSSNRYIDDILVFNPYIHYDGTGRSFNPQSFLQQSLSTFNAYNFGNRTP